MPGSDHPDPALEALLLSLRSENDLAKHERIAFLGARPHADLKPVAGRLQCEQSFKPLADALEQEGFHAMPELQGRFPLVLVLPGRQKEQVLADIAKAAALAEDGGRVVVSMPNDLGAKRFEEHLASAAGSIGSFSKNKCRVFWAVKNAGWNEQTLAQWREAAEMKRMMGGRFWSRPGLFSWDRIDPGSQLLAERLPAEIGGAVADLGAGWGFLSDFLLRHRPEITALDCYEADRQAHECLRRNLGLVPVKLRPQIKWHDVTQGLGRASYDWIVMNPPFHETRQADPALGLRFIVSAAQALRPHGQLWLVANKHLPYENLMRESFVNSATIAEAGGFKVMMGAGPGEAVKKAATLVRHRR